METADFWEDIFGEPHEFESKCHMDPKNIKKLFSCKGCLEINSAARLKEVGPLSSAAYDLKTVFSCRFPGAQLCST